MRTIPGLRRAFRFPFGRHQVERDVGEELEFHLAMRVRELEEEGMDPQTARAEARRRFGDVEAVRRRCLELEGRRDRVRRRRNFFAELGQDLGYAGRSLREAPGFAVVAVLTLALGLGATTGIYSVVDGILLAPLPHPEPDRLVAVWADVTDRGGPLREWLSYPNYHDLRAGSGVFEEVGLYDGWAPTLSGRGEAVQITACQVTRGMLSRVLRAEPALGRGFLAEEDTPGGPRAVLLSHGFWTRVLGGDTGVLGTTLTLDGEPHSVVGVMPEGFRPPFVPRAEVWRPLQESPAQHSGGRGEAIFRAVGRLAPGVSSAEARAAADGIARRLERDHPEDNTGVGFYLAPLRQDLATSARTGLWTLLAAVGFVLLIACLNVANLLLARGASRSGELSLRAALGAGRGRIARQLLAESGLLAAAGGGLGLALAYLLTRLLVALAPQGTPRLEEVAVDGRILAFTAAVTVASVLVFGLAPALRSSRVDLHGPLRGVGRGGGGGGTGLRSALVAAQVAVALVLLVGAGLLVRSFRQLQRVDLGFEPAGRLTLGLNLTPAVYPDRPALVAFVERLEARLAVLPGVEGVGVTSSLPLTDNNADVEFIVEGRPIPPPGEENIVWSRRASAGYFEAMGIPLTAGRPFDARDGAEAPRVVIVNETLAERYFPGEDPLGKRINMNAFSDPVWREIVGVAHDVKNFGLQQGSRNAVYFPYAQQPLRAVSMVLRSAGAPPASLVPAVRRAIAELDPGLAVADVVTMDEVVRASLGPERFVLTLISLFAALALVLAAVGIYGLVSYGVHRRAREMGVRIALGARGGTIQRLVVGRSLGLVGAGLAAGLVGSYWLTRLMAGLLFEVSPSDPLTFGAVALLLAATALLASVIPARRAARVDPVTVLKSE